MNNHYHLLIETLAGNLSKGMRQLSGVYTLRYDRRNKKVGHVFQGRYKAILIQNENAEYVFHEIEEACKSLSSLPDRGHIPPEPERIGVMNFKEIHFKPYRIIYEVMNKKAFVHCVLDGRRNLRTSAYKINR